MARLDNLERRLTGGNEEIDQVARGFNLATPGGSLLLLNHEHWILPDDSDIDVIGALWTATFWLFEQDVGSDVWFRPYVGIGQSSGL